MAGLNPNFIRKVLNNPPFTDTTKYRYFVAIQNRFDTGHYYYRKVIERIELDKLDTDAAYNHDSYKAVWCGNWSEGAAYGQQG